MIPQKATAKDLIQIADYLVKYADFVPITNMQAAIGKAADIRKIKAALYLTLIEKEGDRVRLTEKGREFARGNKERKQKIIGSAIKSINLYRNTVDWMYQRKLGIANRTDIASFWTQNYIEELGGATGDNLSDGAVFFIRIAELAGLGKFITAGRGRESHLKVDRERLEGFYETDMKETEGKQPSEGFTPAAVPAVTPVPPSTLYPSVNVNIQIHISADAKPSHIRDVFKYMAEYIYQLGRE